jgi:DNA-binding transcriptional regulator GbsR (MarR family)
MKKDIKTIDQLLNQIQEIKKEVNEYKDKAQRMLEIKDQIIDVLERQKAIYKRDLNIMLWVCFVLSICAVTMLIITL